MRNDFWLTKNGCFVNNYLFNFFGNRRFNFLNQGLCFIGKRVHNFFRFLRNDLHLILRIESGSNYRYTNEIVKRFILANTHDDIRRTACFFLNEIIDFTNFVNRNFLVSTNDEQEHVIGAANFIVVQQGRIKCAANGL